MAIQTQFRRGNSYSHSLFTGASGEITVDLDKKTAVVHDGATVGGFPLALSSYTAAAYSQANAAVTIAQLAFNAANVDLNYSVAGVTGNVSNIQLAAGITSSGLLTTANVSELNNLYYTNARVYAAITGNLALKANITDLTTANVVELTNLYYTNARVYANVTERLVNLDTNVIPAASEIYSLGSPTRKFKDLYLSGNTIILGNTTISSTTDGLTVDSIRANVWNGLYTANVVESPGNLYYTNARVYSAVSGNLALKANVADLTTANVAESAGNLYYTVARANAAIDSRVTKKYVEDLGIITNANTANSALTANVSNTVVSINNFTTSDLAEGTNLYFSNSRSRSSISVIGKGTYDSGIGVISINAANVTVSMTAPASPYIGDTWIEAGNATAYLYINDGANFQWVEI